MRKPKSQYTPEQKLKTVIESLVYPDGIGAYCRSKGIRDTQIYKWKEKLLGSANEVYGAKKKDDSKETEHQSKIARKDEIICELVSENITLKKKFGM